MAPSSSSPVADATNMPLVERLKHFNAMLVFIMVYMAMCAFNFGYDVGTFGGVQAMTTFIHKFGHYNAATDAWALPSWLSSVMNAVPFLGKALGCIACGSIAERWGRRAAILGLCIVSIVGVTLQTAAQNAAMFTVGRVIAFIMTGMAIVVVPIYQAETCPRVLRGMFASTIQVMIIFGQVIATVITYGTKTMASNAAWQIPIGLQLVMPVVIFLLLPFLPESPRWLLSRDRHEDAARSLKKLRKDATDEDIQLELEALAFSQANERKGPWSEVFDTNNRVRTAVAVLAMFGQQITGQAFPSQYAVVFYKSQGFGNQSFLFNIIQNIISLVAVIMTWFFIDQIGRRVTLLVGGTLMAVFLFILGGMGTIPHDSFNTNEKNLMVTSLMLFQFFFNLSWAPASYVIVSEAAALAVKEKTNLLACTISVLTTFVTSFTIPYLINAPYANLGAKVGFIYGSINVAMVVLVFFFIPELKGRTLEEIDQLFASGVPLRKFSTVETKRAEDVYREKLVAKGEKEQVEEVEGPHVA